MQIRLCLWISLKTLRCDIILNPINLYWGFVNHVLLTYYKHNNTCTIFITGTNTQHNPKLKGIFAVIGAEKWTCQKHQKECDDVLHLHFDTNINNWNKTKTINILCNNDLKKKVQISCLIVISLLIVLCFIRTEPFF